MSTDKRRLQAMPRFLRPSPGLKNVNRLPPCAHFLFCFEHKFLMIMLFWCLGPAQLSVLIHIEAIPKHMLRFLDLTLRTWYGQLFPYSLSCSSILACAHVISAARFGKWKRTAWRRKKWSPPLIGMGRLFISRSQKGVWNLSQNLVAILSSWISSGTVLDSYLMLSNCSRGN